MTRMMPGAAEVMPEVSPVPLLQRRSATEARWHEPVSTSRESARKSFGNVPLLHLAEMEGARSDTRVRTRAAWPVEKRHRGAVSGRCAHREKARDAINLLSRFWPTY